jgi:hypothetical protein
VRFTRCEANWTRYYRRSSGFVFRGRSPLDRVVVILFVVLEHSAPGWCGVVWVGGVSHAASGLEGRWVRVVGDFGDIVGDEPGLVTVSQAVERQTGPDRLGADGDVGMIVVAINGGSQDAAVEGAAPQQGSAGCG